MVNEATKAEGPETREQLQKAAQDLIRMSEALRASLEKIQQQVKTAAEGAALVNSADEVVKAASVVSKMINDPTLQKAMSLAAQTHMAPPVEQAISEMQRTIARILGQQHGGSTEVSQQGRHFSIRPARPWLFLEVKGALHVQELIDRFAREYGATVLVNAADPSVSKLTWRPSDKGPSLQEASALIENSGLRVTREGFSY